MFGFIKNRDNKSNAPKREIDVLTPRLLEKKEHSAYHCVEELRLALNHPDCLNIALTGGYGSGKSSVIKTFLHEDGKKYNSLKISLSNFIDKKDDKKSTDNSERENDYENQIESKIFQHIIYKANYNNTSKSKFHRIHLVCKKEAIVKTCLILLFVLCYIIAFEPVCLQVDAFYDVYHQLFNPIVGYWINIVADILSMIYMFLFVGHLIAMVCRRFKPMTIKSISAKEVSLEFESGKSAFKELLGEILYFFKAGNYDLIIFEDLDRINNPQVLFLKFREINQLLNESDDYLKSGKKVRFLYAIRDDVFTDEVRTKCFDYMIPVVPVIDKFNAGDYMIAHYQTTDFDQVDAHDILALGMFIGSMRELTNVMNEYRVYKSVLLMKAMSQTKLLASIIYKNAYPCDYADFQQKKGDLYAVLSGKTSFAKILTKDDDELLQKLDEEINKCRSSIVTLRRNVLVWLEQNHSVVQLIIDENRYKINDVAEKDDLYDLFVHNKFDHYYYETHDDAGVTEYNFKFSDIISSIEGGEDTYYENMDENECQLTRARQNRTDCFNRIALTTSLSLQDIIAKIGNTKMSMGCVNSFFASKIVDKKDPQKLLTASQISQARLIHAFIKNGYIDEDLDAYVSFAYPGSKSSVDFEFLHSVLQGIDSPYDLKLDHPDEVIKSLHTGNMSSKEVLNYDIVECVLNRNDDALIQAYFNTIRNNLDFVVKYYETNRLTQRFADALFFKWDNCVDSIVRQLTEGSEILFELLFMAASQTCNLKSNELSILSDKYEFICQHIAKLDTGKIKSFIHHYRIKFTSLTDPTERSQPLFEYVTQKAYFEINYNNLKLIYGEDFDKCSYTCIINGNKQIDNYISKHIIEAVDLFPESDTEESIEAIAALSQVQAISDESFEKFLRRQTNIMQNFEQVREERIPLFMTTDKVKATWPNIQKYYKVAGDLDVLLKFIIDHYKELAGTKLVENEVKPLQRILMCDNKILPLEIYKALLPCFDYYFEAEEIKDLDIDRLRVVLEADYIEYNNESAELYASKNAKLFGYFLVHFFDEFKMDESFEVQIPNETGIQILNSHLSIEQKKYFIDNLACPLAEDGLDEYSHLICLYYSQMPIDDDTSVSTIINALDMCNDKTGWKQKIDLINRINEALPYDEKREKALLHSLKGEYLNLSTYRGVSHFDDNEENRKLLYYLLDKGHYVSKIKEEEGSLKVTFRNPPSED